MGPISCIGRKMPIRIGMYNDNPLMSDLVMKGNDLSGIGK